METTSRPSADLVTNPVIPLWVCLPLSISVLITLACVSIVVLYNRDKPPSRRTVMDGLVESFCVSILIRVIIGHSIWVLRATYGPLPMAFAYLKVTSDRLTIFAGFSLSLVMALVRYAFYVQLEIIYEYDESTLNLIVRVLWISMSTFGFLIEHSVYHFVFEDFFLGIAPEIRLLVQSHVPSETQSNFRSYVTLVILVLVGTTNTLLNSQIVIKEVHEYFRNRRLIRQAARSTNQIASSANHLENPGSNFNNDTLFESDDQALVMSHRPVLTLRLWICLTLFCVVAAFINASPRYLAQSKFEAEVISLSLTAPFTIAVVLPSFFVLYNPDLKAFVRRKISAFLEPVGKKCVSMNSVHPCN